MPCAVSGRRSRRPGSWRAGRAPRAQPRASRIRRAAPRSELRAPREGSAPRARSSGGPPRAPRRRASRASRGCTGRAAPAAALGRGPRAPTPLAAPPARARAASFLGRHCLSNATCLIRPQLFYVCFVVSMSTIMCYILRQFCRENLRYASGVRQVVPPEIISRNTNTNNTANDSS